MKQPKISAVMSVYNGEQYLAEALDSLLRQSYENWECVLIDDCSTDRTAGILADYAGREPRIRVYRNEENLRLPGSLNRALSLAEGEYIVRMDADDICRRDRLEKQAAFMEAHPEISLSSCRYFALMGDKALPTCLQMRGEPEMVRALFLFSEPILHPGVIARKEAFAELRYDKAFSCTEDLELWTRMLCAGKRLAIQPDYLMLYRLHEKQTTVAKRSLQREQYGVLIRKFYDRLLFPLDGEQTDFLTRGIYYRDVLEIDRFLEFIQRVREAAREKGSFQKKAVEYAAFETVMAYRGEFGLSRGQLVRLLSAFSPVFLAEELPRRKRAARRAREDIARAAEMFSLTRAGEKGRVPIYERREQTCQ